MKKDVLKKLKKLAEQLPVNLEVKPLQSKGSDLKKAGTERDRRGKPIRSSTNYISMKEQQVNHFNKLKDVYKKGGFAAVQTYCVNATKKNSEQNKRKQPEIQTL